MFTRPFFEPDRAASLAFCGRAPGFGVVCAYDGGKPVASSLPFLPRIPKRRHALAVSFHVGARAMRWPGLADRQSSCLSSPKTFLAVRGERRRCVRLAALVRLAGSGADLAVSGGASVGPRPHHDRTGNWPTILTRSAPGFESWLAPKAAMDGKAR